MIDEIIELEWKLFDEVKNEGGRASCQDDFTTFEIMRKAQYLCFKEEVIESYKQDLENAYKQGRNLISEKYGHMMKSTAPDQYALFKDYFPVLPRQRLEITEEIIAIQVKMMEEFALQFPKFASQARVIHTYEDTSDETSYETYLRGELMTYSDSTFVLYGLMISEYYHNDYNLAYHIMNETAKLYGYESV